MIQVTIRIFMNIETNPKTRALSPVSQVSSFKQLHQMKWENFEKIKSPKRFGNKPGTKHMNERNKWVFRFLIILDVFSQWGMRWEIISEEQ